MTTIKLRRGTAAQWTTVNPILAQGEPGFETDTGKHKIGNGVTNWAGLKYYVDEVALSNAVSSEVSARDTAINTAVLNLINGAPTALDTLLELSAQLANDESAVGSIVSALASHTSNMSNPHGVTKAQVGLGSVPNVDPTVAINTKVPKWQATTAYTAGDVVMAPDGSIVKRLTSGTSGSFYSSANWQTVATVFGTQAATELSNIYAGTVLLTKYATADGTDQTTQVQAAFDALASGATLEIPTGTKFRVDGQINITKPVTIMSRGRGGFFSSVGTTAQKMFYVTSGDVHFKGVAIIGSQFATNSEQYGIYFLGIDGTAPLYHTSVRDCAISGFGKSAIRGQYLTDFNYSDNDVTDCAYAGIGVLSAINGTIDGNLIQNITQAGSYVNCYGIFTSRNQTADFTVDPRSENISICDNRVFDMPTWDGINTHAGKHHLIANNVIRNAGKGVEIVGCVNNATGQVQWAPLDILIIGNTIWQPASGDDKRAIAFVGAQGPSVVGTVTENATGMIAYNIIHGGALDNIAYEGTIRLYYTTGVVVTGNIITEASPNGITFYHDNYDFACTDNVITDPWTDSLTVAAGINVYGGYNTGLVDRNTVLRATRSAAVVLSHGLYVSSTQTGVSISLGRNNRFSAATTAVRDNSLYAGSMAMAGVGLLASRPTASSALLDKFYLATDVLSGTLYYCRNMGSGAFAWSQAGGGVAPDDGLWRPRDNGWLGVSVDPTMVNTNQVALVSGTQYVSRVKADQANPITKLRFYINTAGTSLTEGTATIYDSSGAQLCTQDITAILGTTSLVTVTFTTPSRAVAVGELLYVILRCTHTGTGPVIRGISTSSFPNGNATGAATRYGTLGTGVSAPPATITPSSILASSIGGVCIWVGLI